MFEDRGEEKTVPVNRLQSRQNGTETADGLDGGSCLPFPAVAQDGLQTTYDIPNFEQ